MAKNIMAPDEVIETIARKVEAWRDARRHGAFCMIPVQSRFHQQYFLSLIFDADDLARNDAAGIRALVRAKLEMAEENIEDHIQESMR